MGNPAASSRHLLLTVAVFVGEDVRWPVWVFAAAMPGDFCERYRSNVREIWSRKKLLSGGIIQNSFVAEVRSERGILNQETPPAEMQKQEISTLRWKTVGMSFQLKETQRKLEGNVEEAHGNGLSFLLTIRWIIEGHKRAEVLGNLAL